MPTSIRYAIAMPQPHTHFFHVALEVGDLRDATLDVALPVWTPGSYMVRDYARHVQEFTACDAETSQPLPWRKTDKTTWQIETGGAATVRVCYKLYANELTVRTSHLDGSHGYFNPATVCMYAVGRTAEPHAVAVEVPDGWRVTTGLTADDRRQTADDESGLRPSSIVHRPLLPRTTTNWSTRRSSVARTVC